MNYFVPSSQNYNWVNRWSDLDWNNIERRVFGTQKMIFYAIANNDVGAARNLQYSLLNDYEAKLLAVRKVTQKSTGKKTPGIDHYIALTDEQRFKLTNELVLDGSADMIRRVYIPKPGVFEFRPLGIPTIFDRAKQCLCKFALEPEFEARFETNSFGFRPGRSPIDAVCKIRAHLIFHGPCYVFDTDIRKCFDKIDHTKLLYKINNIPLINKQISAWLQSGIFEKDGVVFPKEGTPQGGVISPLLANIALDGIQKAVSDGIYRKFGPQVMKETYYCRYADDLVLLQSTEYGFLEAKRIVESEIAGNNLELKLEKTRVIKTLDINEVSGKTVVKSNHFDFLGFRFKQRYLTKHKNWKSGRVKTRIRTLVLVSPDRITRHKASISARMKKITSAINLIKDLNPRITGWCNYFKNSDAKEYGDLPRKMDLWINSKLRKWIRRGCKTRGKTEKFWKKESKDWIFHAVDKDGTEISLIKYNSFNWSISDYKPIDARMSIYSLTYEQYKNIDSGEKY